jgi:hypothetical protein
MWQNIAKQMHTGQSIVIPTNYTPAKCVSGGCGNNPSCASCTYSGCASLQRALKKIHKATTHRTITVNGITTYRVWCTGYTCYRGGRGGHWGNCTVSQYNRRMWLAQPTPCIHNPNNPKFAAVWAAYKAGAAYPPYFKAHTY